MFSQTHSMLSGVIFMINVGWKGPFLSQFSNNVWKQKKKKKKKKEEDI